MYLLSLACDMDCALSTCCCAGLGLCRQKIKGTKDSIAFLAAGGTLIYRDLEAGEQIIVDSRSVVAFEETVVVGIIPNGRFCTCCCGGEGCFSTTLTGPGKIFMQVCCIDIFFLLIQFCFVWVKYFCSKLFCYCLLLHFLLDEKTTNFQKYSEAVTTTVMVERAATTPAAADPL